MSGSRGSIARRPSRSARSLIAVISISAAAATTSTAAALPLTVAVDAGLDAVVAEGSALQRSVAIVDGLDNGAPGWTYTVNYGDGSAPVSGATALPSIDLSHTYLNGPATFTATVSVTDDVGETATDTVLVAVTNVAPTPVVSGNATTNEGGIYTVTLSAIDPGVLDPALFSVDWGDGSISTLSLRPAGTYSHIFADDDDGTINSSIRNMRVTVFDDVAMTVAFVPVIVNNVAPTIALVGAATAQINQPYSLTLGAITDPGKDTVTSRVVHWGDGTADIVVAGGVSAHTYTAGGTTAITVDLVDEDGTFVAAGSLPLTVVTPAPTAPSAVTAVALSRSSVRLNWTNTTTPQTSIEIERCKGATCTNFTRVATLPGTATTFTNTGLSSKSAYRYRIRVKNAVGYSPYTTSVLVSTLR